MKKRQTKMADSVGKDSVGKDSVGKDSVGKDSGGQERSTERSVMSLCLLATMAESEGVI